MDHTDLRQDVQDLLDFIGGPPAPMRPAQALVDLVGLLWGDRVPGEHVATLALVFLRGAAFMRHAPEWMSAALADVPNGSYSREQIESVLRLFPIAVEVIP